MRNGLSILLVITVVVCAVLTSTQSAEKNTKPDCVVSLVRQPAFSCELVRLQNQHYLRCALATGDSILLNPIALLAVNFPDTADVCKWQVVDHRLQAKLNAMPDELFIFAIDSTELIKILQRPNEMLLVIVGLSNRTVVVKISYDTKQQILYRLGASKI
jgi:hypothetical protein